MPIGTLEKITNFLKMGPLRLLVGTKEERLESDAEWAKLLQKKAQIQVVETQLSQSTGYISGRRDVLCGDGQVVTNRKMDGTFKALPMIGLKVTYPIYGVPYLFLINAAAYVGFDMEWIVKSEVDFCIEPFLRILPELNLDIPMEAGLSTTVAVIMDLSVVFYFIASADTDMVYFVEKDDTIGPTNFCEGKAEFSDSGGVKGEVVFLTWSETLFDVSFGSFSMGGFDFTDPCS